MNVDLPASNGMMMNRSHTHKVSQYLQKVQCKEIYRCDGFSKSVTFQKK